MGDGVPSHGWTGSRHSPGRSLAQGGRSTDDDKRPLRARFGSPVPEPADAPFAVLTNAFSAATLAAPH